MTEMFFAYFLILQEVTGDIDFLTNYTGIIPYF